MNKRFSSLIAALRPLSVSVGPDPEISGIEYDSRKIGKGDLFVAFQGIHSDGHDYIAAAIARGAAAVLHDKIIENPVPGVSYARVVDARLSMGPLAAAFYDNPSSSLCVIGVTGTEGKSTTVSLIYQLLNLAGTKAGFFSTVMSDTGSGERPNPEHQTTPEATAVQRMLATMRDAGCACAVVESSSHGLSDRTGRLADVAFDIGVMTNVTSEHLEFHGTWERYRHDKANLFRNLDAHDHMKSLEGKPELIPSAGIVNADDPSARYFASCTAKPSLSYSAKGAKATISAVLIVSDPQGSSFLIEAPELGMSGVPARINLPGEFNVGNSLAALLAVSAATGKPCAELLLLLPALKPVRGRMMNIEKGQPFEVIIDYAHTPSSFEAILPPIRKRVEGRVFCLFGSGGERDTEKRPRQGAVAAEYCDVLILTDEDPRGENPMDLLEEIAAGCPELPRGKRLFLIPDRPQAIRKAFSLAKAHDAVLLLGKGHENSIIYKDHSIPYDEETEAIAALAEMGFLADPAAQS
ncbi:MAG TPA: UDP-N-acetylmuramoyl-L-alanyl-D-glutamate--2,6-diaminopimelate ligase [Rectinemataceae bacterium]|nr:UDP-N-acetylmuramoyl-L-alanyl-D-glutamate--2,6-diaminopimelate ligase [Rectinemataceae bacterium]